MTRKRIQLGLLHVAVTITLLPINSALNRVMINELAISAALVALLASLPYLFSPMQVAIGSFSDRRPVLGFRRSPYILFGLLLCVAGVILSPRVAFLLVEDFWAGVLGGVLAFGAWGIGFNFAAVSYFSLATELSGEKRRSGTVAVMFFMMVVSIILASLGLSRMLPDYELSTLTRAFTIIGLTALALGLVGLVALEPRVRKGAPAPTEHYSLKEMYGALTGNSQAKLFFVYLLLVLIAILGQDILLEPFAARAFNLSVETTTRITSIWGTFFLLALALGAALERRIPKLVQAKLGAWSGVAAYALIILSGIVVKVDIFYYGVTLLGLAIGLATVSNLSLMLDMTAEGSVGLYIGAWGMANAFSRLGGNLLVGVVRDMVAQVSTQPTLSYLVVFGILAIMLLASLYILPNVDVDLFQRQTEQRLPFTERAALANEA